MDSIPQRTCKKCSVSYPLTPEFWYKDKKAKEGLSYSCKECAKAKALAWHYANTERTKEWHREYHAGRLDEVKAYRAENAEKIAQQKREWRQNNPEKVAAQKKRSYERCKEHIQAYQKRWREKNVKRRHDYAIAYYEINAPKIRRRACLWAKANPEKMANHKHMRRAQIKGNGGDGFFKADKDLQLRSQKGLCWWCSKPMGDDVTIDHIVAINIGGRHDPRNIVLAHKSCNSSKSDKLPQDWAGRLF
jgi:hypothetical protein